MPIERSSATLKRVRTGSELLGLLRQHIPEDFQTSDFLVAGSARLWVEGVSERISDLDILVRPGSATWSRAADLALDQAPQYGIEPFRKSEYTEEPIAQLYGGAIEVFQTWLLPDSNTDLLLAGAEEIIGLKFLPMDEILKYKRWLDRKKDRADCAAIHAHRRRSGTACQPPPEYAML